MRKRPGRREFDEAARGEVRLSFGSYWKVDVMLYLFIERDD